MSVPDDPMPGFQSACCYASPLLVEASDEGTAFSVCPHCGLACGFERVPAGPVDERTGDRMEVKKMDERAKERAALVTACAALGGIAYRLEGKGEAGIDWQTVARMDVIDAKAALDAVAEMSNAVAEARGVSYE